MLKIGESLNSSIPKTLALFEPFDEEGVRALIRAQKAAGAEVLDLNTALCTDELGTMKRLFRLVEEEGGLVPMLDSPDSAVLAEMLSSTEGAVFVNSVTLTDRRELIPLIARQLSEGREVSVVALPVSDTLPGTAEERRENVRSLLEGLIAQGIPAKALWLDLLIESLATDTESAARVFDTLSFVQAEFSGVRTLCGLSNVSFGLPMRAELNAAFATALLARGLSGAILNVTSPKMRRALAATELLFGEDDYCVNYLSLYRELDG